MGRSGSTDTDTDTLHLEVNDAGGWRRVMSFDGRWLKTVEWAAHFLLEMTDNARLRARIMAPGSTAPVRTWNTNGGWQDFRGTHA